MKNKSSKLAKLERERYSILTDNLERCFICGRTATDIHEIYSGGNRKASMRNGFCCPLCRYCHQIVTLNYGLNLRLKMECQEKFEETATREDFMQIIHKNYLE